MVCVILCVHEPSMLKNVNVIYTIHLQLLCTKSIFRCVRHPHEDSLEITGEEAIRNRVGLGSNTSNSSKGYTDLRWSTVSFSPSSRLGVYVVNYSSDNIPDRLHFRCAKLLFGNHPPCLIGLRSNWQRADRFSARSGHRSV